ncbi:hypothetical protein C3L29_036065 [Pseudomonas sp. MWU12-2534b]|nr:hypothetical protein C3L29_036065 [Pseudomonas sp. MWU12-2534b]
MAPGLARQRHAVAGRTYRQYRSASQIHRRGHPVCLSIKCLFNPPLRQSLGIAQSLLQLADLDWPSPDHSTACRR